MRIKGLLATFVIFCVLMFLFQDAIPNDLQEGADSLAFLIPMAFLAIAVAIGRLVDGKPLLS